MVFKAHLIPFILLPLTTATDSPSTSPSKSPSNSPSTSAPTVTPSCYPRWQPHSTYTASRIVSRNVLINATLNLYDEYNYQCREAPLDQYCGQVGYEPGLNGDYGVHGIWYGLKYLNVRAMPCWILQLHLLRWMCGME